MSKPILKNCNNRLRHRNLSIRLISKISYFLIFSILLINLWGCSKYLDEKPDKSLVIPKTVNDLQLLLDDYNKMNFSYTSVQEVLSDNYYITFESWQSSDLRPRAYYTWSKTNDNVQDWVAYYNPIYNANIVLDVLPTIKISAGEQNKFNEVKGIALFYRAYNYYQLVQLFAPGYDKKTSLIDLGIPLRLTSDFNESSTRATVAENYNRILTDLKDAVRLLPNTPTFKNRPSKVAAYAALARVFLTVQDFDNALLFADSSLKIKNTLLDFNSLTPGASNPIAEYTPETLFHAVANGEQPIGPSRCRMDTFLIKTYNEDDLRFQVFFRRNADGSYRPKGNYSGYGSIGYRFSGLATNEMFLTRAECYARAGETQKALDDLNQLLSKRWSNAVIFTPVTANSAEEALIKILLERRKELLFSLLRWTDLRRLNKEEKFAISIKRILNGTEYILTPNSPGYTLQIPKLIIDKTGLPQNP